MKKHKVRDGRPRTRSEMMGTQALPKELNSKHRSIEILSVWGQVGESTTVTNVFGTFILGWLS